MILYHGTTVEQYPSIFKNGLKKGAYLTPDYETARYFAEARSYWNRQLCIILIFKVSKKDVTKITLDRKGRKECQAKRILRLSA